MEKIIIKTIREAFKEARINKMLKESSENLAKKIIEKHGAAGMKEAEKLYSLWMGGRATPRHGEVPDEFLNYIVEKAAEEYKQTKDSNLRDKIATVYYPLPGSKWYNTMAKNTAILGNLRKRYGKLATEYLPEILLNAYTYAIQPAEKFDKLIASYKVDSPTGIGAIFKTALEMAAMGVSSKSATAKRGGPTDKWKTSHSSIDDPLSFKQGDEDTDIDSQVIGTLDRTNIETGETDDFGSDVVGGLDRGDVDFEGGEETKDTSGDIAEKMIEMFNYFADEAVKLPNIAKKETLSNLIIKFFKNRMSYEEILKDRPDLYPGKSASDMSAVMINMINNNLLPTSYKVGRKFGFPKAWLDNIMEEKSLKDISKVFKLINPEKPGSEDDDEGEFGTKDGGWSPLFEKTIEENMDKIVKEVYKRLAQLEK